MALTVAEATLSEAPNRGWYPRHPGPLGSAASLEREICHPETHTGGGAPYLPVAVFGRPATLALPHPSRSFKGNSPKPAHGADPQFRRRELRATRRGRGGAEPADPPPP